MTVALEPRRQSTLLASSVFALLMAFYLMKPAREALLATSSIELSSAELRAAAAVAQGLFALLLAATYGRLSDHLRRRTLITGVDGGFALLLAGLALGAPYVGEAIWLDVLVHVATGAVGVIVIAQFWAFATDLEGRRAGRTLPLLALAASAGGVAGAYAAACLIAAASGPRGLFAAAAFALCVAAVCSARADAATSDEAQPATRADASPEERCDPSKPFALLGQKYLLGAAVVTLLAQWVSTNGESLLFGFVQASLQAGGEAQLASGTMAFYAGFSLWSNVAALAVQLAVVYGCARGRSGRDLLLVLPVVTLASAAAMMFVPALGAVKCLKVAENAARLSIHNTAAQLLWLPTTAEMKYKAKIVIETVIVRFADALAALTVFVGLRLFDVPLRGLYLFNILLALVWMVAAALLAREQRRRLRATGKLVALPLHRPLRGAPEYRLAA